MKRSNFRDTTTADIGRGANFIDVFLVGLFWFLKMIAYIILYLRMFYGCAEIYHLVAM